MRLQPSPAKLLATELGLAVATPEKSRAPDFVEYLESLRADALVVASYGQILSQRVLDSARWGGINLHGSLLPKYRGAAPIQRSILAGEKETGVTLMQMDKGMDTGDLIHIARTEIDPDETYGELQDRLALIAAEMATAWLPRIVAGDYSRTPQNSNLATTAPKVERVETALNPDFPAAAEYNRFRAFTPQPGTVLRSRIGPIKLHGARLGSRQGAPGDILSLKEGLEIAFASGSILITELQPEGKKRMSGRDFANGARLRVGERLL